MSRVGTRKEGELGRGTWAVRQRKIVGPEPQTYKPWRRTVKDLNGYWQQRVDANRKVNQGAQMCNEEGGNQQGTMRWMEKEAQM